MNIERRHTFERNVYLVSDINHTLTAIDQTASNILQYIDSPEARAYAAGHRAALEAVAKAFNVEFGVKR